MGYMVDARTILIFVWFEHFIVMRCSLLRTYELTKRDQKIHQ